MWSQFLLENLHFAINLVTGLVMLSVFWLYLDVYLSRKTMIEGFKAWGFLCLAVSYFIHSVLIESTVLAISIFPESMNMVLFYLVRLVGFTLLVAGLALEPIQKQPHVRGLTPSPTMASFFIPAGLSFTPLLLILDPILSGLVTILYLRRSFAGLERHLRLVGVAFGFITLSSLLHLTDLWRGTNNPATFNLIAPFGPIWILEHLVLLVGSITLGYWVFSYLMKRMLAQLFIISELTILTLFLIITVTFSALILSNLENQTQSQLQNQSRIISVSLDSKKSELLSYAKLTAQNPAIQAAVSQKNPATLASLLDDFFLLKKETSLVVTDVNGVVIGRAEDRERIGNSLSDDPQIKKALLGEDSFSVISTPNPIVPQISLQVTTPIKEGETVIGAVLTSLLIDDQFAQQLKGDSTVEVSFYSGNVLSATTLINPDGGGRPLGIKEENPQVKIRVLNEGRSFAGRVKLLNMDYLASFLPLKDLNNQTVGMLAVGQVEALNLEQAARSISLTFIATLAMLLLSIIPVFLISRYLSRQFRSG